MTHPVEDTEEYYVGHELKFARLISELYEMEVIHDDHLIVAAKNMGIEGKDTNDMLQRAQRMWRHACEVAEADQILQDIRACVRESDQSMADHNFEDLDKHMSEGKQPPTEWTKGNK